jgi:hypothetical protein
LFSLQNSCHVDLVGCLHRVIYNGLCQSLFLTWSIFQNVIVFHVTTNHPLLRRERSSHGEHNIRYTDNKVSLIKYTHVSSTTGILGKSCMPSKLLTAKLSAIKLFVFKIKLSIPNKNCLMFYNKTWCSRCGWQHYID